MARVTAALAEAPVAIGSRPVGWATGPPARRLASRLFNRAIRLLLGLPFGDTQCGLKGFRRYAALEVFGRARLDGFAFDAEVLFLARRSAWWSARSRSGLRSAMAARSSLWSTPWACCAMCCGAPLAISGGYDRAISVVPDPSSGLGLGAEIGQAAQPS